MWDKVVKSRPNGIKVAKIEMQGRKRRFRSLGGVEMKTGLIEI